jgi:hypothetical protein
MNPSRVLVVAGDVMIDENLAIRSNPGVAERSWTAAGRVHLSRDDGGAALLKILVHRLAGWRSNEVSWTVRGVDTSVAGARISRTYTLLAPDSDRNWRVEKFLGVQRGTTIAPNVVVDDTADAEIVLLLDADMGFRNLNAEWPLAIGTAGKTPWVILKTCAHDFEGELWQRLLDTHADKLIVVTSIDDLRRRDIQISRRLSWERTAEDLVWEMRRNPAINVLSRSRHSVVSFGPAGAVLLSRVPDDARLIFDSVFMEGEWEPPDRGGTIGYTVTLAAAIADELMRNTTTPNVLTATNRGIAGMRALNDHGYGNDETKLAFPFEAIAKAIVAPGLGPLNWFEDRIPVPGTAWTVLQNRLGANVGAADHLYELAGRVASNGPEAALNDVPQARIGELFTVDRDEIESLRSIKSLLTEYVAQRPSKPVSIAVFGPPGSGKSFGVKQVAKSLEKKNAVEVEMLTFNVSQFVGPEDLHGAFHQVRDVSLSGKVPVVFWDEFDTPFNGSLGWLRYFLAPMQDGEFQEQQITHPIGTSIFVFAGGTASELGKFGKDLTDEAQQKNAKLPDFLSRLKGFLNVLGPNPRKEGNDPYYVLRRAILLRSILKRQSPSLFHEAALQIDAGVLRALLLTIAYKHGARSMEAVIAMSALSGKTKFERSSLPSQAQLDLHVDSVDFMSRMQELQLTEDIVEKLAEKTHMLSPVRDLMGAYVDLPEGEKDSLRAFVRSIPPKLATLKYVMTPARLNASPASLSSDVIAALAPANSQQWLATAAKIPQILASAGYTVIKLPGSEE